MIFIKYWCIIKFLSLLWDLGILEWGFDCGFFRYLEIVIVYLLIMCDWNKKMWENIDLYRVFLKEVFFELVDKYFIYFKRKFIILIVFYLVMFNRC